MTLNFIIDRLTTRVSIRQISILQQPRHHPPLLNVQRPPGCQGSSRSASTVEAMYMKLISLPVVHQLEDTLAQVHDTAGVSNDTCQDSSDVLCVVSGLPWWATIMVTTAVFRLLFTLPAHVTQQKVMAKR